MPIAAGGILVAATATTRCLSSAAGMLRFLARLSGRRRHVRRFRSCLLSGPGAAAAAVAAAAAAAAAAGEEGRTAAAAAGGSGGGGGSGGNGGGGGGGSGSGSRPHQQPPQQPQLQQPHQSQSELQSARIMEEETTTLVVPTEECTRCRCRSSCSCALLGLDDVDCTSSSSGRTSDDSTSSRSSNTPRRRRRRPEQELSAAVRSDRDHSSRTPCGRTDRDVLRRRPPESTSRALVPPPYLATLLILSYSLIGMADACSSRSTPKPRPPTPTPRPNITFHMYTCPPDYAEWYCLNGATCFTVKIVDSLLYNCLCANGYIGQRCEFKDLDGSYLPSRQRVMLETASIAGAVTIAVFLAVITFISVYIHCKRKQKELRTSSGVDAVDGLVRDPELRPFCNRSRSLMTFMAKNPNCSTTPPSIEHTRMPNWNYPAESSAQVASVNENKCPSQ